MLEEEDGGVVAPEQQLVDVCVQPEVLGGIPLQYGETEILEPSARHEPVTFQAQALLMQPNEEQLARAVIVSVVGVNVKEPDDGSADIESK